MATATKSKQAKMLPAKPVFYAHDSNTDDRCHFVAQPSPVDPSTQQRWPAYYDCKAYNKPKSGYWQGVNTTTTTADDAAAAAAVQLGRFVQDDKMMGASSYDGTGCHFSWNDAAQPPVFPGGPVVDQINGSATSGAANLTSSLNCECNSKAYGGTTAKWSAWLDEYIKSVGHEKKKPNAPAWGYAIDFAACWVTDMNDMILLQNLLWSRKAEWNNQHDPNTRWDDSNLASLRYYWGWNEVPAKRDELRLTSNWDALAVTLPVQVCADQPEFAKDGTQDTPECMDGFQSGSLVVQLDYYVEHYGIKLNQLQVAFLRTFKLSSGGISGVASFNKQFFCIDYNTTKYQFHKDCTVTLMQQ